MKEYKVVDDKKTVLFLEPIPRWITLYGFMVMLALATAVLLFSYFVKIPRTISTTVVLGKENAFAILSFDESRFLQDSVSVYINTPFDKSPIIGEIRKSKTWAEGDKVFVPVVVSSNALRDLSFQKELRCSGEIVMDSTSLFQKVFVNIIPR